MKHFYNDLDELI